MRASGQDILAGVVSFEGARFDQGMASAYARVTSRQYWSIPQSPCNTRQGQTIVVLTNLIKVLQWRQFQY